MEKAPEDYTPTTVQVEDLSAELYLARAPRDAAGRPELGGIPLSRKIGRGGMGAVYLGTHPRLHCAVAVKVLSPDLLELDPSLGQRFLAEARMAAGIRSPHVVQMLDVHAEPYAHYCVMEYVEGETAGTCLKRARNEGRAGLDEEVALEIVKAATRGLADAHAAGIVHRDVKPENILVPRHGGRLDHARTKLLDLGLARPAGSASSLGTIANMALGTPGYMAPEQVRDARSVGRPADVFSMGATLYALLAGRPPFDGSGVGQVLADTERRPHEPLPATISARTRLLVDRCLEKDPARRPADGKALLEALSGDPAPPPRRSALPSLLLLVVLAVLAYFATRLPWGATDAGTAKRLLAEADVARAAAGNDPARWQAVADLAERAATLAEEELAGAAAGLLVEARRQRDWAAARRAEAAGDLPGALELLRKALDHGPAPRALQEDFDGAERALRSPGERERRRRELEAAAPLVDFRAALAAGDAALAKDRPDEARRAYLEAGRARPGDPEAARGLARAEEALASLGIERKRRLEDEEFLRTAERPVSPQEAFKIQDLAIRLAVELKDARGALPHFKRVFYAFPHERTGQLAAFNVGCCYVLLGDKERALDWMEICFLHGFRDVAGLERDGGFAALQDEPRYKDILRRARGFLRTAEERWRIEDRALIAAGGFPTTPKEQSARFRQVLEELTNRGRYAESIAAFKGLFYGMPDTNDAALACYNISCAHALRGEEAAALDWLEIGVSRGLVHAKALGVTSMALHARKDPDLRALWRKERFDRILRGGERPWSDGWGGFRPGTRVEYSDGERLELKELDGTKARVERRAPGGGVAVLELPRRVEPLGQARITVGGEIYVCRVEKGWTLGEERTLQICLDGPEAELAPLQVGPWRAQTISRETVPVDGRPYECTVVEYRDPAGPQDSLRVWWCRHVPGAVLRAVRSAGGKDVSRTELTRLEIAR